MAKLSAGLLLYRRIATTTSPSPADRSARDDPKVEVLLVHPGGPLWARKEDGAWSIPKGEIEPSDPDPLAAAEREVHEELGIVPPAGDRAPLGQVTQAGGKRVLAWAIEADLDPSTVTSNRFEMEWPPQSGQVQSFPEVDRAAWYRAEDARRLLNPAQVALLERLVHGLQETGS